MARSRHGFALAETVAPLGAGGMDEGTFDFGCELRIATGKEESSIRVTVTRFLDHLIT
jgi:hypothetical protein